jgi:hypothetical protein
MNMIILGPFALLIAVCIAFLVWAIVRAIKTKNPGWAALGGLVFLLLFLVPAFFWISMRATPGPGAIHGPPVEIRVQDDFQTWKETERSWKGADIAIQAETPRQSWVDDAGGSSWQSIRSGSLSAELRRPGPEGKVVGYSEPCGDDAHALRSARESLKNHLAALIRTELFKMGRDLRELSPDEIQSHIGEAVDAYLRSSAKVREYREKALFKESGITMHRAALLSQIPPDWPSRTAREVATNLQGIQRETRMERRRTGWTIFSTFVLALVVFLLYNFLNAGTKGHFAWPLRLISIAAFVLLCLGLLAIRGYLT